ncbi:MAG: YbhB/YbcL family Raf kinase inhibitor-like protein [Actinomycetota bacterium]|nr:YbhB/YbcL family Raf kinase inhibitor-like protein [Actinomycetota bacterium]
MKIESPAFKNNGLIPSKYTCDGIEVNPPLVISDVPKNAKSLALVVDDPDATGGTWIHWTVWDIDPEIIEIPENSCPPNTIQGVTDSGSSGYCGPCPPSGTHRYFFKLYALNSELKIGNSARSTDIEREMRGKILAKAELIGLYRRK